MIENFSLHFTPKGQNVKELMDKFKGWIEKNSDEISEQSELNHCFLSRQIVEEKQLSSEVLDEIDSLPFDNKKCWNGLSGLGVEQDRVQMLSWIVEVLGVCIFIGEIKAGVKEEFDLATKFGCKTIVI